MFNDFVFQKFQQLIVFFLFDFIIAVVKKHKRDKNGQNQISRER